MAVGGSGGDVDDLQRGQGIACQFLLEDDHAVFDSSRFVGALVAAGWSRRGMAAGAISGCATGVGLVESGFLTFLFAMIEVIVNGAPHPLPATSSVAALVAELGLTGKRLAVERNGEIVPRGRHADTLLTSGDTIEIVVAVGGG